VQGQEITDPEALVILLTAESLIFAVLSAIIAFAQPGKRIPDLPASAFTLGVAAVALLGFVAFGALMAWIGVFTDPWPCSFRKDAIAVSIAIAILAQPFFAIAITRGMRARP
jgi:hypothetical protein